MYIIKISTIILALSTLLSLPASAQESSNTKSTHKEWKLVWKDEFNGKKLNPKNWTRYTRNGQTDWDRHMSGLDSLCKIENGILQLWGINTPKGYEDEDNRPFLTGGVGSKGLRSVKNGRFEVRARYDCAQGFWPAIWLMPDIRIRHPYGGEIDIMEHLNYDNLVFQTVHTPHTLFKREPTIQHYVMVPINKEEFNTYAVEVSESEITFYVNGEKTFSYKNREPELEGQFPFYHYPFYVILSAQLGGDWVGKVNPDDLPVKMEIDYVRVYERR